MKYCFLYFLMIIFWSCKNTGNREVAKSLKNQSDTSRKTLPSSSSYKVINLKPEILSDSIVVFKFKISDTLFADFNCDEMIDRAFFKHSDKKTQLVISDAKTFKETIVGNDPSF